MGPDQIKISRLAMEESVPLHPFEGYFACTVERAFQLLGINQVCDYWAETIQ